MQKITFVKLLLQILIYRLFTLEYSWTIHIYTYLLIYTSIAKNQCKKYKSQRRIARVNNTSTDINNQVSNVSIENNETLSSGTQDTAILP